MTLSAFRDYCRAKADDPHVDPDDAQLWTALADEVDNYLADTLDVDGAETDLFS